MKTINRLFAAALVLFAAAACYNKEIEAPDNQQDPQTPDVSEQTGLKITASIIQTRVTYTDGTTTLNQQWEKGENGDIVFGFIDDANHTPVVLKVDDIINGVATLVPTTGEEALSAMDENTYVNLIYTGGSSQSLVPSDETYSYSIDMTDQDGKIPACMHARARKEGNAIEFDFVNDCAILEIVGITGVSETVGTWTNKKLSLGSVTVSGVNTSLSYTYANGDTGYALSELRVSNAKGSSITIYPENESLYLDNNGNIVDNAGNSARILMAVPQNTSLTGITVSAEGFGSSYALSSGLSNSTCYVVKAQDVVAKTEDGLYFKTVSGAFDHAADLSSQGYTTAEDNVVTLIKKEINGLGNHPSATLSYDEYGDEYDDTSLKIQIDYPVTLDLNGCTLSLSGYKEWDYGDEEEDDDDDLLSDNTEYFYVCSGGDFTITDSKGPDGMGNFSGTLTSGSDRHMIISEEESTITINGGSFEHTYEWCIVSNYGELNVLAGDLSSNYAVVDNYGTLNVSGVNNTGCVSMVPIIPKGNYATVYNNKDAEINIYDGTTIEGINGATIYNYRGTINIHGGSISSDNTNAIDSRMYEYDNYFAKDGEEGYIIYGDEETDYDNILPRVIIDGGSISSVAGAAAIQNGGYLQISGDDTEISGESAKAIINWAILEIEGGEISSTYEVAISSADPYPEDKYYCNTVISGGTISSTNNTAIKVSNSYNDPYEMGVYYAISENTKFSISGGTVTGNSVNYGIELDGISHYSITGGNISPAPYIPD